MLSKLKTWFFAGLLVCTPLVVTLLALVWLIKGVDNMIAPYLPKFLHDNTLFPLFGFHVPGVGLLFALFLLTVIGGFTRGFLGRFFLKVGEKIIHKTPVVNTIYGTLKKVLDTIFNQDSNAFKQAVLVQFPSSDNWVIAFVTGDMPKKFKILPSFKEESREESAPSAARHTVGNHTGEEDEILRAHKLFDQSEVSNKKQDQKDHTHLKGEETLKNDYSLEKDDVIKNNASIGCNNPSKDRYVSVYIPNVPIPTNGFMIYVKETSLIYLDITVQEALTELVSMGVITPDNINKTS